MADDTVWNLVNDFLNGDISREIFWAYAKFKHPAHQTSFHSINRRRDVVEGIGREGIARQLRAAGMNHCLSLEQVSDELIEDFSILNGNFDTVSECQYNVPSATSIGKVYQRLVLATETGDIAQTIMDVFISFISDEISDFNSNVYYSNPDYLRCCYEEGRLLA